MRGWAVRWAKWVGLGIGVLFGSLGWAILKVPSLEVAGQCLFYFPALAVSSVLGVTATDRVAVVETAALYGLLFFLIGWALGWLLGPTTKVESR